MTRWPGDEAKARLAAAILLTLSGTPFLYYGEEIGMAGTKPDERIRTPMQWTDEETGHFTLAAPSEALSQDRAGHSILEQTGDPE